VASIRTLPPVPVPVSFAPGRRPSKVVERELSSPPASIFLSPKVSSYAAPSAERSSTRTEMNAGTRTTDGLIAPFSPVNSASVSAACSSPAPPWPLSPVPVPSPSFGRVSVSGLGAVASVSDVALVCSETVPSCVAGGVGSSSPPHPPRTSSASAKTTNLRKGRIDTIMEAHDREAMDTR
jgi:hypothetical protein